MFQYLIITIYIFFIFNTLKFKIGAVKILRNALFSDFRRRPPSVKKKKKNFFLFKYVK